MKPGSVVAIYVLLWVICFFVVLPFGVRTSEEAGTRAEPGHAESAPHQFSFGRAARRATMVSAGVLLLFYLNYIYGWITPATLDWTH